MRVILVGREFDFSSGDGVSRYSAELYSNIRRFDAEISTVSIKNMPRPLRALTTLKVEDSEIVHLMYPDIANVDKGKAKMITTWHDTRLFKKYSMNVKNKTKQKAIERFGIAGYLVKRLARRNYINSDAIICVSSLTAKQVNEHFKREGIFDPKKRCYIINDGIDDVFVNYKPRKVERKDFVYIGSVGHMHKNIEGLLELFGAVASEGRKENPKLHIFTSTEGARGILNNIIINIPSLALDKNVILHHRASDTDIMQILPRAISLLHLSMLEGFGMPIIESLAVGTPVLTLKDANIPKEVIKYTVSDSYEGLIDKAKDLVAQPRAVSHDAIKYAKGFTWQENARKTLELYKKLSS